MKLEDNWDGYNAEPLDPKIIAVAREIAGVMPKVMFETAQPVPMSNGRVQFEWHEGGRSLEVEVNAPDVIVYLKCPVDADESTWEEDEAVVNGPGMRRLFDWWMRGLS